MTKNQKIAVGCSAVGCLGLIVLALVGGGIAYWQYKKGDSGSLNENRRYSSNSNSNSDGDSNANSSTGPTNRSSSSSTESTVSDDDKHKLFQAAGMTKDQELILRVMKKIGLFKADGTPAEDYPQFIKDQIGWAVNNTDFINSVNTPDKAKAYVDQHLGD